MADFAKITARVLFSKNSDYSNPKVDSRSLSTELTPDEYYHREISIPTDSGYTIDLGNFNSITAVVIVNHDTANDVKCRYYYQVGSLQASDAATMDFTEAGASPAQIVDLDGADFTVTGVEAVAGIFLRITSANTTANDGLYLVSQVTDDGATNDKLVLAPDYDVTNDDADELALLSFEERNTVHVGAGGFTILHAPVTAGDLLLVAETAAVECEVFIFGT